MRSFPRVHSQVLNAVLILSLAAGGCSTFEPSPAGLAVSGPDIFNSGDKITVVLTDIPNAPLQMEQVIPEGGEITLHLNFKLLAIGRTVKELQDEIHRHYVPRFYQRCTVNVRATDRYFYVDGFVKGPNRYLYSGDLTVLKAVTAAGGFSDFGNRKRVQLIRVNGKKERINCDQAGNDPRLDLPMFPGDRVYVPKRIL
jgi:protein involved in polysaccharide export with SLBB domain